MSIDKAKLLDVAARVYGEYGFRGATTRRIADEAGVNEITIFRQFGSKESLINEAIRTHSMRPRLPELAVVPVDPERELTEWGSAVLAHLSDIRSLIRRMMSEMDERPEVAPCLGDGPTYSTLRLREYVERLREHGFLPDEAPASTAGSNGHRAEEKRKGNGQARTARSNGARRPDATNRAHTAVSMLMSAFFADAMGREILPAMYPQPLEDAAAAYVALFLRALGVRKPASSGPEPKAAVARSKRRVLP
jgi:AcrR family transcriptional regulator